jgi:hypothetical protein
MSLQGQKYSERADDFRLTLRTDVTKRERYIRKAPQADIFAALSLRRHMRVSQAR